jgi:hypothetical protein
VREKNGGADFCVEGQRAEGFSLGICLQIDHADGVCAGLAGLECGAVRLRHGMAMGHCVCGGIGKLVLHTLRPAYGGGALGQEQQEQERG